MRGFSFTSGVCARAGVLQTASAATAHRAAPTPLKSLFMLGFPQCDGCATTSVLVFAATALYAAPVRRAAEVSSVSAPARRCSHALPQHAAQHHIRGQPFSFARRRSA